MLFKIFDFLTVLTVAWIIGPESKTVAIVQIPNLPPSKTPIITIIISRTIRTILIFHPFFSASENVTASYEPLPKSAAE